jgi:hypothetical protein
MPKLSRLIWTFIFIVPILSSGCGSTETDVQAIDSGTAGYSGSGSGGSTIQTAGKGGSAGSGGTVAVSGGGGSATTPKGGNAGTAGTAGATAGIAGAAGQAGSAGVAGQGTAGAAGTAAGSAWPSVTDFSAAGPFKTMQESAEAADCTIFRPSTLGEQGRRHPVVIWGNGTGSNPQQVSGLLTNLASHGVVVSAANTSNAGSGQEMLACLDYILKQNTSKGSAYEGKIDPDKVGASGWSQGGNGTLQAGKDPRVIATAPVCPYRNLGGDSASAEKAQHAPMFQVSGGSDNLASKANHQEPVFNNSTCPIIWGELSGATHMEITGANNGMIGPITAWYRYKLMGDAEAGKLFKKDTCLLCKDSNWKVQYNSLWKD